MPIDGSPSAWPRAKTLGLAAVAAARQRTAPDRGPGFRIPRQSREPLSCHECLRPPRQLADPIHFRSNLRGHLLRGPVGSRPTRRCRHRPRSRPIQAPRPATCNRRRQGRSQRAPASAPPPTSPGVPRSRSSPNELPWPGPHRWNHASRR